MSPDEVKNSMRIYAVEALAANLLAMSSVASAPADPQRLVSRIQQQMIEGARKYRFPGVDTASSDLASAELENAVDRLMGMVRAQIAVVVEARKTRG